MPKHSETVQTSFCYKSSLHVVWSENLFSATPILLNMLAFFIAHKMLYLEEYPMCNQQNVDSVVVQNDSANTSWVALVMIVLVFCIVADFLNSHSAGN